MNTGRSTNQNPKCDSPQAKRIVIVDDHPLFRKGLEDLIHSDDSFAVCGEASTASEAMEVIRKLHPDLVIVDLSLPGANGIELIKNIRAEYPKLPILVLSMHDESLYALRAMRAGADFIKTSTGKIGAGATLPGALCMMEAARDFLHQMGRRVGVKVAGGVRQAKQAIQYLVVLYETLGDDWMTPDLFRIGASTLLNDLLMQIHKERTGVYQGPDYFTID